MNMDIQKYEMEHLKRIRKYVGECPVLLKYDGNFPIAEAGKIAVYGNGVRYTVKGGTGSGEVNSHFYETIEMGLEKAGFVITTKKWLDKYDKERANARKRFRKEIKRRARKKHTQAVIEAMGAVMPEPEYDIELDAEGDTAIYVLARISGEGNDRNAERGDILLTETEVRDILKLNKEYHRFMLVLNVGGPVDLSDIKEVKNILLISQLGIETGSVLSDILLGRVNPSGKLTTTWARWNDYCSMGDMCEKDDAHYREGIYVGYRYFDIIRKKPLFHFGYGLSYTSFEIAKHSVLIQKDIVTIKVKVKNTGKLPGKEVIQVYISCPDGKIDKPYQELIAFAKTKELKTKEMQTVEISFSMMQAGCYDSEHMEWILEAGKYIIRVGNSSDSTKPYAAINLAQNVVLRKVKNTCGKSNIEDWKPEYRSYMENMQNVPEFEMDAQVFKTEYIKYNRKEVIDDKIKKLTDEQLAYANIGTFDPKGGILSVIGNASWSVAGAAGESTNALKENGFPVMVMADGPAGLRLSQKYYKDEKGVHSLGEMMPASFREFLPKPVSWFLGRQAGVPKDAEVKYQYTTAIPIGTAIAQSWNLDFAYECGNIVGEEMEMFGVHLWLAPALNIHRNIRCGRNFEYFSEDPVISGYFASTITKGVQSHKGCGVTIKHYAANNQETNRYANNSVVSERALREIYLKGFEICVKEAQPYALMTSYNLLNGIHTSEHKGIIEDILRCEFGYKGIVMTDWMVAGDILNRNAKYAATNVAKAAAAGNNLFMPGHIEDYKQLLDGLREGLVTREQLEISATKVYEMAKRLVEKEGE